MSNDDDVDEDEGGLSWQARALITGGVVGALVGLGAAYLYIRNVEEAGEDPRLGTREAVQLGMSVVGLVRQIASMGGK
jgi:hypothetical protein